MMKVTMNLLSVLAGMARESGDKRTETVGEILSLGVRLFAAGDLTHTKLQQLASLVATMADEDREPTEEEWAVLRSRSDEAHDRIQGASKPDERPFIPPEVPPIGVTQEDWDALMASSPEPEPVIGGDTIIVPNPDGVRLEPGELASAEPLEPVDPSIPPSDTGTEVGEGQADPALTPPPNMPAG